MRTLIFYASTHGHTAKIATNIGAILQRENWPVQLRSTDQVPENIDEFELIIIGSRVRYGKHDKAIIEFMAANSEALKNKETAFFSVNLVARKPEKSSPDTSPYVKKMLSQLSWQPNFMAVFAGKLNYPVYGWVDKKMIQLIMKMTKGPTDTLNVYEFTDWQAVDAFGKEILRKEMRK